jgi:acetoin utilization deacetylase AcuC-like enzyme
MTDDAFESEFALIWCPPTYPHPRGSAFLSSASDDFIARGTHWEALASLACERTMELISLSGLGASFKAHEAPEASDLRIATCHAPSYIDAQDVAHAKTKAARRAAGAACMAAELLMSGTARRAYCLVRPAGHHAERASPGAGCVFNNVALAAVRALELGADRVLILDWDAHHGNGAQAMF